MSLPSYAMNQTSFPKMYEQLLVGPLFRPWADMTVETIKLSPSDRVLDIACGTGIVARVAKERLGDVGYVVDIDVSPDCPSSEHLRQVWPNWKRGLGASVEQVKRPVWRASSVCFEWSVV